MSGFLMEWHGIVSALRSSEGFRPVVEIFSGSSARSSNGQLTYNIAPCQYTGGHKNVGPNAYLHFRLLARFCPLRLR